MWFWIFRVLIENCVCFCGSWFILFNVWGFMCMMVGFEIMLGMLIDYDCGGFYFGVVFKSCICV